MGENLEDRIERIQRWVMFALAATTPFACWLVWHGRLLAGRGPTMGWIIFVPIAFVDATLAGLFALIAYPGSARRFFVKNPIISRSYQLPADMLSWSQATEKRMRSLGFTLRISPVSGDIEFTRFKDGMAGFLNLTFEGLLTFNATTMPPVAEISISLKDTLVFDSSESRHLEMMADFIAGQRDDLPIRVYPALVSSSVLGLFIAILFLALHPVWPAAPLWISERLSVISAGCAAIGLFQMFSKRQQQFIGFTNGFLCVFCGAALWLAFMAVLAVSRMAAMR